MRRSPTWILFTVLSIGACGEDGDNGPKVQCETVPACYTEALSAVQSCVTESTLALGTVSINSGVVQNLGCSATETTVSFSDFSANENGTVPLPSRVTIANGATTCAELGQSSGSRQAGPDSPMVSFTGSVIERPGQDDVSVLRLSTGDLVIKCGVLEEFTVSEGALANCPEAVKFHEVTRDMDITAMSVQLANADDTVEQLFVCE